MKMEESGNEAQTGRNYFGYLNVKNSKEVGSIQKSEFEQLLFAFKQRFNLNTITSQITTPTILYCCTSQIITLMNYFCCVTCLDKCTLLTLNRKNNKVLQQYSTFSLFSYQNKVTLIKITFFNLNTDVI
ncbi:Hypothetical_protein [Hexamita inflata]|uniref:Hypothetical_protein n=1 Tax=Hexamita inflata TaxID=28002 RepID=A0ABP1HEQ3_9EUKA